MKIDLDHVYLLGWYGPDGRSYLTTWEGNLPMIDVVIIGVSLHEVPAWDIPVPPNARIEPVPEGRLAGEYAREVGGIHAFGWYIESGIDRKLSEVRRVVEG